MTCQRRGIGLACIVLCAVLPTFAVVRAADRPPDKAAATGATATAAPAANPPGPAAGAPASPTPTPPSPPPVPPIPLNGEQVLAHIRQTIDWYRESQDLVQVPQLSTDVVERDQLPVTALTGLRLAFDFGRAAATAPLASAPGSHPPSTGGSSTPASGSGTARPSSSAAASSSSGSSGSSAPATTPTQRLNEANARIASRITQLQSQLAAALALEREVQSTIGELQRFQSSTFGRQASGSKDLLGQVADLERTVPELRQGGSAQRGPARNPGETAPGGADAQGGGTSGTVGAQSGNAAAQSAVAFHPESAGIIALISQWVSLESADGRLDDMVNSTDDLGKELDQLRAPLVAQARSLAREDTSGVDSTDPAELEASRSMLKQAAARYRQLAAVLVPLGNQDFVLDSARAALREWTRALGARIGEVARNLLIRVAILATLIVAVFVVSEISRRAVFKYLHDPRLRSQFQTLRRVIVGALLTMVLFFSLVSQLGSLATYVGFLTAGLAVALQTVILSIVAYFFFIGRSGVRVGDRITLSGVTGRVVDIGLIRIYLMELAGADLRS
ncbi:MAG TPA: mechanosensitive ion channel domain-containing protein, partial [Steroidobacteraceae bacterium]